MPALLLIEDEAIMGASLVQRFELEGYQVLWARTIQQAQSMLEQTAFDAVVSDVRLPDGSGEDLFMASGRLANSTPPWLFTTAYASVDRAVAMMHAGAYDYLTKPFDINDLVGKIKCSIGATGELDGKFSDPVLGPSAPMLRLARQAQRVAERARSVLLSGESGTGKEVLARHLHALVDPRGALPFVAVNCGAIPEALIEAELFGHERGAFTGADRRRRGFFEQAHGGTLFLDEIAELSLSVQSRLLRVLQDGRVTPLGAEKSLEIPLRLIFATHRDLRKMVREGQFREDLYYRIEAVQLHLVPLRERPEDILWLAGKFLKEQAKRHDELPRQLSLGARAALLAYHWPGNARELRNRIERACIFSTEPLIRAPDLIEGRLDKVHSPGPPTLETFVAAAEREYLAAVLERFQGKVGAAAQALGISRKTLWEKTRRYGLGPDSGVAASTEGSS